MNPKICFVTTGDISTIATAKRALGLANPLTNLGWEVHILLEDCLENHHRCELECDERIIIHFFPHCSLFQERKTKNFFIKEIKPDFIYCCAFVPRNIVGINYKCKKLVEHSELQSKYENSNILRKLSYYFCEYYSIFYSDALLNASKYLQKTYKIRTKKLFRSKLPLLYFPYAFNPQVVKVQNIDYSLEKFNRFAGKTNYVFLGSVVRGYGIFTILDAAKLLKEKKIGFNILILGKGPDHESAMNYVKENGLTNVVFMPGYISEEEISDYFSIATAFLAPLNNTIQDWARCPSKLFLFMPYFRPIITCRIGEAYETLKENGLYYEPNDSVQMSKQMFKVATTKEKRTCIDINQFTWETRALELNDFIITTL